ncbi:hypothetical protein AB1Y20_018631 [Prymnesium parvum]|uniref:Ribosomal RNA large subunit methyltransferase K/L-like methyltransferase domain-containing protein n=1 Tax=Prymnesium parvum TaxID=97485 RepID=A0AB34JMV4_PRYPA
MEGSAAEGAHEAPRGVELLALVAAGLDHLACEEIQHKLSPLECAAVGQPSAAEQWAPDGHPTVFPGTAGVAKLRLRVATPSTDAGWRQLRGALASLKSVQAMLLFVGSQSHVPLDGASGVPAIEAAAAARVTRWREAYTACCRLREREHAPPPSFRASAVRDGQHDYSSMDVARALGRVLCPLMGWRPQMVEFDVEAVAILLQRELLFGLALTAEAKGFRRGQLPAEPRPLLHHAEISARLRSSTAHLMLRLAEPRAGELVCDPMCGVGTLPLEAAATLPMVMTLAGDADAHLLSQARWRGCRTERGEDGVRDEGSTAPPSQAHENGVVLREAQDMAAGQPVLPLSECARARALPAWHYDERRYAPISRGSGVLSCVWDATRLPLRPGCVDALVVDLPFGMVHKVRHGRTVRHLYTLVVAQAARVLRAGGRLVMLTPSRAPLDACLAQQAPLWDERQCIRINCGGALAWVCVWARTSASDDINRSTRVSDCQHQRDA